MGSTSENKPGRYISVGILAHVDAGKTTLSESILYLSGKLRKLGRVDHKDAFLDTNELERERGITIFSKQAVFDLGDIRVTLLDTPGHVDFSAEMERTLQVLDYAILVINGADGVQGHTRTLWNLLKRYQIPVFLFVNKMDQPGTDYNRIDEVLKKSLSEGCIDFGDDQGTVDEGHTSEAQDSFLDSLAMCDEEAMDEYLESGMIKKDTIARMIAGRKVFPCYYGSALKVQGVQEFLAGLERYMQTPKYVNMKAAFGAKVYKISRDVSGSRLTHLKVTSGVLRVKDILMNAPDAQEHWEEKVNQIRIYSGEKYEMVPEVQAGTVCAVTGLSFTYPGEGLGTEHDTCEPVLQPVLNYRILLPDGCDVHAMLGNLRKLEEEDPMLRIVWNEELGEIYAQLMGEVQIEILKRLILERFGVEVTFDTGNIVYKETIANTVEGVGHFEPLRHYAEVHLIMEPGQRGSGLILDTNCSEDVLDKNWQRLILTHLAEKEHRGVLTGSAITDMKITLAAGRAHLKHTEGGDFRQATYRAVRQGLMQAENVLLEPYYDYRLEVPAELVGRALTDIQRMSGEFEPPQTEGEMAVVTGYAPVAAMRDYQMEVTGYTRGRGRLSCTFRGYEPCQNEQEVIEMFGYDPERDLENPTGSVFCSHGAGYNVPWNEVTEHMHIESQLPKAAEPEPAKTEPVRKMQQKSSARSALPVLSREEEKELEDIFIRTYGRIERRMPVRPGAFEDSYVGTRKKKEEKVQEYLLVDGYNVIFAWDDLKELAAVDIGAARDKLMDTLCNYQGFKKCVLILVFDAYRVEGYALEIQKYRNIHVVYTKEAETADQYIEKVVHHIGRKYHVTVVTSDGVEQVITMGQGGTRVSSRDFLEEVRLTEKLIREEAEKHRENGRNYLFDHMDEELVKEMEEVRLGKKTTIGER
ncbi:translation factor GTPase family protein [Faecalicatena contorta]|uniref:translation factor GTPase family protein n=1 Tax=Faecalicatena contorta TaxID=39482 RepID=UPI001F21CA1D|nr:TetM/TetW/TetO/TetS family tetracycline resistance ribosomal protection protein [Faecalicatena contorta]MCF2681806.1 TetM/TetW/TetO/TetS family tetracycline resistance ribosomal protection protein [Faecalicatena contorta]